MDHGAQQQFLLAWPQMPRLEPQQIVSEALRHVKKWLFQEFVEVERVGFAVHSSGLGEFLDRETILSLWSCMKFKSKAIISEALPAAVRASSIASLCVSCLSLRSWLGPSPVRKRSTVSKSWPERPCWWLDRHCGPVP